MSLTQDVSVRLDNLNSTQVRNDSTLRFPDLAFLTLFFQANITNHILQMKQKDVVHDSMLMSLETNLTTLETDFVSTMHNPIIDFNFF